MTSKAVIEITDHHIKLLTARDQHAEGLFVHPLPDGTTSMPGSHRLAEEISSLLKAHPVAADDIVMIIPRRLMVLRELTLPSQDPAEIRRMIGLQLSHHIPYASQDVVYDHAVIENQDDGYSRLLLAAIQKDSIHRLLDGIRENGLTPSECKLSSTGIVQWYLSTPRRRKSSSGSQVLINFDTHASEICFLKDAQLTFSRHLSFGLVDLATNNLNSFLEQIELNLGTYKKDHQDEKLDRITLLAPTGPTEALKNRLQDYYHIEVDTFDPAQETRGNLPRTSLQDGPGPSDNVSLTAGLGLLLAPGTEGMNFLPPELHRNIQKKNTERLAVQLAVAAACALVLFLLTGSAMYYRKNRRYNKLTALYTDMKKQSRAAAQNIAAVELLEKQMQHSVLIADLLRELYAATPESLIFTRIEKDAGNAVMLEGLTSSPADIQALQSRLTQSGMFRDIQLHRSDKRNTLQQGLAEFKMTGRIVKGQE